jgi:hypothetical protein
LVIAIIMTPAIADLNAGLILYMLV